MKKTAIILTTVAALGAVAMTAPAPAQARDGRNAAAIGAGIAAGAIAAGVAGGGYGPYYGGYGYGPRYYGPGYGSYAYYGGGPYYHRHWRHYRRHR
ncbi:MAG: hypothetical protein EKK40_13405 [Bradyrhizobiaceae bacterium]|nr:MAG: hypothetical protein EKK40_13405 [Bradyrhizobiaceae bacterium]